MIFRNNPLSVSSALLIVLTIGLGACKKVKDDHEINANWLFISYTSPDSVLTYSEPVNLEFEGSEKIKGNGPVRKYTGTVEIWKDGSIQMSELCCGDTAVSMGQLPQIQFYSYLNQLSNYQINGNELRLSGTGTEMLFEKQ